MIDDTNYLTTALSGVKMASLDASQETTVPSGTLVRRRTLEWMGVGNHFAHLDNIAVVSRMRRERCVLGQRRLLGYLSSCLDFYQYLTGATIL